MHADCENLSLWYLSIGQSNLGIEHTVTAIRISKSFLWYAMNDLMHVMQLWFLGIWNGHFLSYSKTKLWVQNWVSIECLSLIELKKWMSMSNKDIDFSNHDLIEVDFSRISYPSSLEPLDVELVFYCFTKNENYGHLIYLIIDKHG